MTKGSSFRRIRLKAPWEISLLRAANQVVAEVLNHLKELISPGISTWDLDKIAEEHIRQAGCEPAFKGYHGYPATICISINDEIVHGIPSKKRVLNAGDLVSIDVGTIRQGYFGDAAFSQFVSGSDDSHPQEDVRRLLDTTREALYLAIGRIRPKRHLGDIGATIEAYALERDLGVVRQFVGHGIGTSLHEPPEVPNYGIKGTGPLLKKGMVIAIEPMFTLGSPDVRVLQDGWTAVTRDGSWAAHFEHTIAITDRGAEILSDGFLEPPDFFVDQT